MLKTALLISSLRALVPSAIMCVVAVMAPAVSAAGTSSEIGGSTATPEQDLSCAEESEASHDWRTALQRAEAAFEQRADGAQGAFAAQGPIRASIACFRQALRLAPERFDVRIGLMHALLFEGEYAARSKAERKQAFLEGRDLFEDTLDLLTRLSGKNIRKLSPVQVSQTMADFEEARPIFFLGALHWGLWADYFGTIAAVRAGVAKRIRVLAETTLAVTPDVDEGGAHRLMGRLHFLTPRIPFVTSWVDRKRALVELEKAVALGPTDPLNLAFLAEAVAEVGKDRERARELLLAAVMSQPRVGHWIEDLSAIEEAKKIRRELKL